MIIANLIGFGMGHNNLYEIILKICREASYIFIIKVILFLVPSVIVMFYIREKEENDKKNAKNF